MVILRVVLHLRMPLAAPPAQGSSVDGAVSALAMTVILTVVVGGAIMIAIAARRAATGGRGAGASLDPSASARRKAAVPPADAWSEAGRRMPVPPRDKESP